LIGAFSALAVLEKSGDVGCFAHDVSFVGSSRLTRWQTARLTKVMA
jgi:hypothetical protein